MYAPLYNILCPTTDQYPICSLMVDTAHGETPSPVVGANNPCKYHLYMPEIHQKLQKKQENHIE